MLKRYVFLLIPCLVFLIGCEAFSIISPAVNLYIAWKEGEAQMYYEEDALTIYESVQRMLKKDGIIIEKSEVNEDSYYILAKAKDKIKITIENVDTHLTCVRIRINIMGDKPYAEFIYKKLSEEVKVIDYETVKKRKRRLLSNH